MTSSLRYPYTQGQAGDERQRWLRQRMTTPVRHRWILLSLAHKAQLRQCLFRRLRASLRQAVRSAMLLELVRWTAIKLWSLIVRLLGLPRYTSRRIISYRVLNALLLLFLSVVDSGLARLRAWLDHLSLSPPSPEQTDENLAADAIAEGLATLEDARDSLEMLQAAGWRRAPGDPMS